MLPAQTFEQARVAAKIEIKDTRKRVPVALLILVIVVWAGGGAAAPILALVFALSELQLNFTCRRVLSTPAGEERNGHFVALVLSTFVSTTTYQVPALVLASQASVVALLAGLLWTFGVLVHVSNTYAMLPIFFRSQMAAAGIATVAMLVVAATRPYVAATGGDLLVPVALLAVYGVNTAETLLRHKGTHLALRQSREEANKRLSELEHLARHDTLTGLLNRQSFEDELGRMIQDDPEGTAVFIVDLDGFKPINDTYSHRAGDRLLAELGDRLGQIAAARGIAARIGGDEFGLAFSGVDDPSIALARGYEIAGRLRDPVSFEATALSVTASVGIAISEADMQTAEGLTSRADQAMYRSKISEAREPVLYAPGDFAPRLSLLDRAVYAAAIKNDEITPNYQPRVCLRTGRTCGFEALARWRRPNGETVMPSEFLPALNELGLQGEFTYHLSRRVLEDVSRLLAEGIDPGQVSINIPEATLATHSGRQDLEWLLTENAAALDHITFEITEDVFIARSAAMIQQSIRSFSDMGVKISLDDFGTGYASFQHLRQLKFDELKIDTSFVAGLGKEPVAEVIVQGFLSIASGLGVGSVAEGIETEEQRRDLLRMGCKFGQGFLFGRAEPFGPARERLLKERAAPYRSVAGG